MLLIPSLIIGIQFILCSVALVMLIASNNKLKRMKAAEINQREANELEKKKMGMVWKTRIELIKEALLITEIERNNFKKKCIWFFIFSLIWIFLICGGVFLLMWVI